MPDLDPILKPRSVAVIGASRRADTIGHEILANIVKYGFTGAVYPVNPKAASIHSIKAYPSVGDIPDAVDLAVIVVPKEHVLAVAESCGKKGVRGLVVISAGFKEVGEAGAAAERQLVDIVRRSGMRMVGPNCMGVLNAAPDISLNATFSPTMPPFGHAAFVSQSGALGLSVLDYATEYGIGISQFVSVGNKPDVSGNDLLLQWEHDATVGVILMYVENFGNPRRFLEIASRIAKQKPIIAMKSGRSRVGARAAASHTGSLAASDAAVDALLTQAGVLRAASMEELFDMAMAFTGSPLPRSRRTAVLTNSGGPGILVADALEPQGIELVDLSPETIARLRPLFPEEASLRNPVDMIASATAADYRAALDTLLADGNVDSAVAIFVPPLGIHAGDVAESIAAAAGQHPGKPVLAVLMGREGLPEGRAELHRAGIPAYIFPESAARALGALRRVREWRARPVVPDRPLTVDRERAARLIAQARSAGRTKLSELEVFGVLSAYGIAVAPARLAHDAEDAARAAAEVGYPVAVKIVSAQIIHKTEVGGVRTGIGTAVELKEACVEMLDSVSRQAPSATIDGLLVQRMISGGRETIVGVSRETVFGPLVMFGLGGIYVEALADVVFRIAPLGPLDVHDMLKGIRGAAILEGVRGAPPVDFAALGEVVRRVGQLALDHDDVAELDINPLLALPQGATAVDARILLENRSRKG
ncbi:MAG TPA: acetate--CoA ligase family protein [Gemmatimonadales bacterium]|jgi:acetyl coenzyme A synthetase (ADP forming)-like protein|nr:acetate--CoA ligase family protein [Gemmatimonadales bacterium]